MQPERALSQGRRTFSPELKNTRVSSAPLLPETNVMLLLCRINHRTNSQWKVIISKFLYDTNICEFISNSLDVAKLIFNNILLYYYLLPLRSEQKIISPSSIHTWPLSAILQSISVCFLFCLIVHDCFFNLPPFIE